MHILIDKHKVLIGFLFLTVLFYCVFFAVTLKVYAEDAVVNDTTTENNQEKDTNDQTDYVDALIVDSDMTESLDKPVVLQETDTKESCTTEDDSSQSSVSQHIDDPVDSVTDMTLSGDEQQERTQEVEEKVNSVIRQVMTGATDSSTALPSVKPEESQLKKENTSQDKTPECNEDQQENVDDHYIIVLNGAVAYDSKECSKAIGRFITQNSFAYTEQDIADIKEETDGIVRVTILSRTSNDFVNNLYVEKKYITIPEKADIENMKQLHLAVAYKEYKGLLLPAAFYEEVSSIGQETDKDLESSDELADINATESESIDRQVNNTTDTIDGTNQYEFSESTTNDNLVIPSTDASYIDLERTETLNFGAEPEYDDKHSQQYVSTDEQQFSSSESEITEIQENERIDENGSIPESGDDLHISADTSIQTEVEAEVWRESDTESESFAESSDTLDQNIAIKKGTDPVVQIVEIEFESNDVASNIDPFGGEAVQPTTESEDEKESPQDKTKSLDSTDEDTHKDTGFAESLISSSGDQPISTEINQSKVPVFDIITESKELETPADDDKNRTTNEDAESKTDDSFAEPIFEQETNLEDAGFTPESVVIESQADTPCIEFTPCITYTGTKMVQSCRIISDIYNDPSVIVHEPTVIPISSGESEKFGNLVFSKEGEYGFALTMDEDDCLPWELNVVVGKNEITGQLYIDTTRTLYIQSYDNSLTNNQKAVFTETSIRNTGEDLIVQELITKDAESLPDKQQNKSISARIQVQSILLGHKYKGKDYYPVTPIKGAIYTLQAIKDAPMPDNVLNGSITIQADSLQPGDQGEGEVVHFGDISFDTPGVYEYLIKQDIKSASGGSYSYIAEDSSFTEGSPHTKKVTINVVQDTEGLSATVEYLDNKDKLVFENRYLAATLRVTWQVLQDEDDSVLPILQIKTNGSGSYPYIVYNKENVIQQSDALWQNRQVEFTLSEDDYADIIALPVGLTYRLEVKGIEEKEISYDKQQMKTLSAGDADEVINSRIYRSNDYIKIDLGAIVRLYGRYKDGSYIFPSDTKTFELSLTPLDDAPMADDSSEETLMFPITATEDAYSEVNKQFSSIYIPKARLQDKNSITYKYRITDRTNVNEDIEYLFRGDPNPCLATVTLIRTNPDDENSEWEINIGYLNAENTTDANCALFRHRYRPKETTSILLGAKEFLYGYYRKEEQYAYPGENTELSVTLKPIDNAPMPLGYEQGQSKTITIRNSGTLLKNEYLFASIAFDEIIYTLDHIEQMEDKDYYYTIETSLGDRADINYLSKGDSQRQLVKVHLTQSSIPVDIEGETEWFNQLTTTVSYANQPDVIDQNAAVFRHQYVAGETIQPRAQIQLIGYAANNRYHFPSDDLEFDVVLKAEGNAPMPIGSVNGEMTKASVIGKQGVSSSSSVRSGLIDFGKIEFKTPGVYHYTMLQRLKTDRPYINPLVTAYPITVTVEKDPSLGRLVVTPDWGASELPLTFTNKYEATYMSITKYLTGKGASVSQHFQVDLQLSYNSQGSNGDSAWIPLKNHLLSYETGSYDENGVYQKKSSGTRTTNNEGIVSVTLAYKDRIRWYGLPDGIRYEITESKHTNYYASYKVSTSKTVDGKTVTVEKGRADTIDVDEGSYIVRLTNTYSTVPITGYGSPTVHRMLIISSIFVAGFSIVLQYKAVKKEKSCLKKEKR